MRSYINFADQFVVWIGRAFAWSIFILTAAVMYEVIMRYFFNAPTLWAFDFTIQMYGAVIMMGGASAISTKSHVKADMYYNRLSERGQAILDLILFDLNFYLLNNLFNLLFINNFISIFFILHCQYYCV